MVDIKRLACGKTVKLPQFIDTDNYDGQVVCQECKSLPHVKLLKGNVQKYKVVENKSKFLNWAELFKSAEEARKQQQKVERERGTE